MIQGEASLNLSGQISINHSSKTGTGIYIFNGGTVNSTANVSVSAIQINADQSQFNILGGNVHTEALQIWSGQLNVSAESSLTVMEEVYFSKSEIIVSGKLNVASSDLAFHPYGNSSLIINSTAEITTTGKDFINLVPTS